MYPVHGYKCLDDDAFLASLSFSLQESDVRDSHTPYSTVSFFE